MPGHLTSDERDRIAQLRFQGSSQEQIAQAIGRCPSTISRELRRNCTRGVYHAAAAQRKAELRRAERPLVRKMDRPEINERVRIGRANEWSPEQIAGRLKQRSTQPEQEHAAQEQPPQTVSPQTIYPDHYADTYLGHDDTGNFIRRPQNPAFEVVFIFDPEDGAIDLFAQGGKQVHEDLQTIFCRSLLGRELSPELPHQHHSQDPALWRSHMRSRRHTRG